MHVEAVKTRSTERQENTIAFAVDCFFGPVQTRGGSNVNLTDPSVWTHETCIDTMCSCNQIKIIKTVDIIWKRNAF